MAGTAAAPALNPSALNALVTVGRAKMFVIGLNPQRIGTMSEGRVVGLPTFGGMDWQPTGLGEAHTRFEAVTFPHVIGGLDAVALLQQHHEAQDVVNFIRLSNMTTYLGRMMGRVISSREPMSEDEVAAARERHARMKVALCGPVHGGVTVAAGGGAVKRLDGEAARSVRVQEARRSFALLERVCVDDLACEGYELPRLQAALNILVPWFGIDARKGA